MYRIFYDMANGGGGEGGHKAPMQVFIYQDLIHKPLEWREKKAGKGWDSVNRSNWSH